MARKKNQLKPIDAPVYRYWEALYLSFFSRQLYLDVGKRWKGLGLLYLFLVVAIFSLPLSWRIASNFEETFHEDIISPLERIPTLYIQNGILSCDKPMPYFIKNKLGQVVLIIDTSGKINNFSKEYPYLDVLINKDKMVLKVSGPVFPGINNNTSGSEVPIVQNFSKEMNAVFNGKQFMTEPSMRNLLLISRLLIYPMLIGLLYGILAVILLVLGFLGQVFARIFFSFQLGFMQGCRVLIVAATPMLIVLMIIRSIDLVFLGSGLLLISLLVSYFSFAIHALRMDSNQLVA